MQKKLNPKWYEDLLENCDQVGISRNSIETYIKYYLEQDVDL